MANYVRTFLQTEKKSEIPQELILLFQKNDESYEDTDPTSNKPTKIGASCKERFHKEFIDEIIELSKKYPTEVFLLCFDHESDYTITHHYKISVGELTFSHHKPVYFMQTSESLNLPEGVEVLIDRGLTYLSKLDVITEEGNIELCPFKTTIEVKDVDFKIVIEKDQIEYKIKKIFKNNHSPIWEKYTPDPNQIKPDQELPF